MGSHHHGHSHGHSHGHGHNHHHGSKNILIAFFLNFTFAIIELIGGLYTGSMAILSDSLHDFGDSMALLMSFFFEKYSKKAADNKYTYGHRRFSVLSALINGLILFLGSVFVIKEAIERVMAPTPIKHEGMLILAILGIVVNGIAAYRLSKDDGLNQRMVMFHLLEDILGWCAVLIVSIVLFFKPWFILDSILSILISLIILRGVYKNMIGIGQILLQKFPDGLEMEDIIKSIKAIAEVKDVHAVKGWSLDEAHHVLNFHVAVTDTLTVVKLDEIKLKIREILKDHHVGESTVEFESENFHCEMIKE
ncbi:cation diffusion facilitator family transporter [Bacteriovorax sp. BSW11_IV]|uniref:cation diffusion facilitator family transporter n=1 Tax=Bacteriovorax sp. BSW11_IV TaxID=1353529 RepID=UPI00038A1AF5|nr:cation diffusion facilitator family transporter [Bacteriovorax sp. BSW11_IV]EQC44960.1 cation diffusion facilitator family transporter [Bacteriovorax sp. BSW11_IV]